MCAGGGSTAPVLQPLHTADSPAGASQHSCTEARGTGGAAAQHGGNVLSLGTISDTLQHCTLTEMLA